MAGVHQYNLNFRSKRDKASLRMANYLKTHKLDPDKDWTDHPIHGPHLRKWIKIIDLNNKKAEAMDIRERVLKKPSKDQLLPKVKKVSNITLAYDYPEDDGRPLTPKEMKAYRQKFRRLLKANVPPQKAKEMTLKYLKKWRSKNHIKNRQENLKAIQDFTIED